MEIIQSIALDFAQNATQATVFAKQYDKDTRKIEITPLNNGSPYTIDTDVTARLQMTKNDGTTVINNAEISSGKITVVLTAQALTAAGTAVAEIGLYKGSTLLSSQTFYIDVQKGAYDKDAPESSDEYNALVEALGEAEQATATAEAASERAEAAVDSANTAIETARTVATGKMSLIPIDPTAEEIEAMPSGQLYGDTVNHKGVIKGGQGFYDTEYIDNSISKIYTSTQRPPWVTSSKDFAFKEGDIWIYKDPSSLTLKKICVFSGSRPAGGVYKELIWQALYNSDNVIDFVLDPPNIPPTMEESENFKPYDIGGIQTAVPLPRFYANDKVRAGQYVGSGKDSARYVYECKNVTFYISNSTVRYTCHWSSPLLTASILSDDFSMSLEPGPYERIMFPTIARMKELLVENYYDSDQINTMIGNIETALSEV